MQCKNDSSSSPDIPRFGQIHAAMPLAITNGSQFACVMADVYWKCCRPSAKHVLTESVSESSPTANLPATSSMTTLETIRDLILTGIKLSLPV
jgi:hypothetical protein